MKPKPNPTPISGGAAQSLPGCAKRGGGCVWVAFLGRHSHTSLRVPTHSPLLNPLLVDTVCASSRRIDHKQTMATSTKHGLVIS